SDKDAGQAHTQATSSNGSYGSWTVDADGHWNYTLDNANTAGQAGQNGDKLTDTFHITSQDGSASKLVTVTINGSNDPTLISGATSGDVTEDLALTTAGTLTLADKDSGDAHIQAASGTAAHGSWTVDADGHWNYSLNN